MKYVFLILLLVVSIGSYEYYGKMKRDQEFQREKIRNECSELLEKQYTKAESFSTELEALENELTALEGTRDDEVAQLQQKGRQKFATLFDDPKVQLPSTASKQRREQNMRLVEEYRKVRSGLETAEKRHISLEKELLARIAKNRQDASKKIQDANQELSQRSIRQMGTRRIKQEALNEKSMALELSVNKINASIRQQIEESRQKLEYLKMASLRRLEEINDQINKLYEQVLPGERPLNVPDMNGASKLSVTIDEFDTEMRNSSQKYKAKADNVRRDLALKQSAIRSAVVRAERVIDEYEEKVVLQDEVDARNLLYVKIIGWGLSICLGLGTIFVFIGSRKVDETPKPLY